MRTLGRVWWAAVLLFPACAPGSEDDGRDARPPLDGRDDGVGEGGACVPRSERCGPSGVHQVCNAEGTAWGDAPCPSGVPCDSASGRCACPAGSATVLTGRVLFPNGREPVARALVYVPFGEPVPPPIGPHCQTCVDTTAFAAWAETAVDGTFRLENVPPGEPIVVVEKGYFQRRLVATAAACAATALPEEETRLPRNAAEGYLPSIAVVTGNWDRMEDVLSQMGLDDGAFDVFEGVFCDGGGCADAIDLLTRLERMLAYHVIFLNCGLNYDVLEILADREDVRANVLDYVRQGGRLYVTDQSYDFVEQALPTLIDFAGSAATPADEPETHGYAQCGFEFSEEGITVPGEVMDGDLAAWLQEIGVASGTRIDLAGFLRTWAVMNAVGDPARTHLWVDGLIPVHDWQCLDGRHPMTVTADVECGKVLYSSYHTVEGSAGVLAQEKVLMYLALEIAVCLDEIVPFL
jgi:hypothetical protein